VRVSDQPQRDQQAWEVADGFFQLIGNIIAQGERLAQQLAIPGPFIKALHTMDCPIAMKDLGKRMHCDPSFVTLVADMLEKRGLAMREPHPADRRIKNLVLTEDGLALKRRVEEEIIARMPWTRALDDAERAQLLALIRKMLGAESGSATPGSAGSDADAAGASAAEEAHARVAELLMSGLQERAKEQAESSPPASTGEVTSPVSDSAAAR
jgi:MarR family transcriptional regulator, organic hydroperoxide resistance regulator